MLFHDPASASSDLPELLGAGRGRSRQASGDARDTRIHNQRGLRAFELTQRIRLTRDQARLASDSRGQHGQRQAFPT